MSVQTCSAEGCTTDVKARGMCGKHWQRWRQALGVATLRTPPAGCGADGCSRLAKAYGLCSVHAARWAKHGDLNRVDPKIKPGPANHQWRGGVAAYHQAHRIVNEERGPARDQSCAHCDQPAADWAVRHDWPGRAMGRKGGREMPYNWDPAGYMPLCRKCHYRYDADRRRVG